MVYVQCFVLLYRFPFILRTGPLKPDVRRSLKNVFWGIELQRFNYFVDLRIAICTKRMPLECYKHVLLYHKCYKKGEANSLCLQFLILYSGYRTPSVEHTSRGNT